MDRSTVTNRILEKNYPDYCKIDDDDERLDFYENLSYEEKHTIRVEAVMERGFSFMNFVVNDPEFLELNQKEVFSKFINIYDLGRKSLDLWIESANNEITEFNPETQNLEVYNAYKSWRVSLTEDKEHHFFPPSGLCSMMFPRLLENGKSDPKSFGVYTFYDGVAFLASYCEYCLTKVAKDQFPIGVKIESVAPDENTKGAQDPETGEFVAPMVIEARNAPEIHESSKAFAYQSKEDIDKMDVAYGAFAIRFKVWKLTEMVEILKKEIDKFYEQTHINAFILPEYIVEGKEGELNTVFNGMGVKLEDSEETDEKINADVVILNKDAAMPFLLGNDFEKTKENITKLNKLFVSDLDLDDQYRFRAFAEKLVQEVLMKKYKELQESIFNEKEVPWMIGGWGKQ